MKLTANIKERQKKMGKMNGKIDYVNHKVESEESGLKLMNWWNRQRFLAILQIFSYISVIRPKSIKSSYFIKTELIILII